MGEPAGREVLVPGGHGGAFEAKQGQYIIVVDLEGQQVGDFVAFNARDRSEYLSPHHTREALMSMKIRVGDRLLSNRRRPMLEVVADTVGIHDFSVPECDPTRYEVHFDIRDHRNCLENIYEALEPYGIDILEIPDPFNLFQNTPVGPGGRLETVEPISKPGDRIAFRTLVDVFGAVSSCPQDLIPANGLRPTPLRIIVTDVLAD